MCSYIVEKAALVGSAKGRKGWMRIDTANVYSGGGSEELIGEAMGHKRKPGLCHSNDTRSTNGMACRGPVSR